MIIQDFDIYGTAYKIARYYFLDNGVRNAPIQNFNPRHLRNDVGQLRENYLIMERRKVNAASQIKANINFWRTYDQKEINYLEERGGKLFGYEFKQQGDMRKATRREFIRTYSNAELQTVTVDKFDAFLRNYEFDLRFHLM